MLLVCNNIAPSNIKSVPAVVGSRISPEQKLTESAFWSNYEAFAEARASLEGPAPMVTNTELKV